MVLTQQWHTSNLTSYYTRIITSTIDWKNECIAHFIAQMISSKTISSIEAYKNNISNNDNFIYNLSCYLKYIPDFSRVIDALEEETLNEPLISALDMLASQDKLRIREINGVVTKSFSTLDKYLNTSTVSTFIKNNEKNICNEIENQYIKNIDSSLIRVILEGDTNESVINSLIYSFESEIDSQESFNKTVIENLTNSTNIINYASKKKYHLHAAKISYPDSLAHRMQMKLTKKSQDYYSTH